MKTMQIGEKTEGVDTLYAVVEIKDGVVVGTMSNWFGKKSEAMAEMERYEAREKQFAEEQARRDAITAKFVATRDVLVADIAAKLAKAGVPTFEISKTNLGWGFREHDIKISFPKTDVCMRVGQAESKGSYRFSLTEHAEIVVRYDTFHNEPIFYRVGRDGQYNTEKAVAKAVERYNNRIAAAQYRIECEEAATKQAREERDMLRKDFGFEKFPKFIKLSWNHTDGTWTCEMPRRSNLTAAQIKQILNAIDPETYKA